MSKGGCYAHETRLRLATTPHNVVACEGLELMHVHMNSRHFQENGAEAEVEEPHDVATLRLCQCGYPLTDFKLRPGSRTEEANVEK